MAKIDDERGERVDNPTSQRTMTRKIAAIMAADVVGYSRLVANDEEDTLHRLLDYRQVFFDFVGRAGGRVFNTAGDSVLAEFPSAVEALRAAIEIQESIRTRNLGLPDARHMRFRIGMTIGDVVERDGDLLGDGVNVAARLESLAEPGGICISRSVHEQVTNKISVVFKDIGLQSVKNIPAPIHAFTIPIVGADVGEQAPTQGGARRQLRFRGWMVAAAGLAGVMGSLTLWRATQAVEPVGYAASLARDLARPDMILPPRPDAPSTSPQAYGTFEAAEVPFVCGDCRRAIGRTMAASGNTALAVSLSGAYGAVNGRATEAQARDAALDLCSDDRKGHCELYAVNGRIVWPRHPPPMPPMPWVDPATPRRAYDAAFVAGPTVNDREKLAVKYPQARDPKALAMGVGGNWRWVGAAESEEDAERRALESCGDASGSSCRIIAVGDQFVVKAGPPPP